MIFYSTRWIKATRKTHTCWWCGTEIEAGSAASYFAGIGYDFDFSHGHAHPECEAALDSLPYDSEGYGFHENARGRTDDDTTQPPQFSPDYRGKEPTKEKP